MFGPRRESSLVPNYVHPDPARRLRARAAGRAGVQFPQDHPGTGGQSPGLPKFFPPPELRGRLAAGRLPDHGHEQRLPGRDDRGAGIAAGRFGRLQPGAAQSPRAQRLHAVHAGGLHLAHLALSGASVLSLVPAGPAQYALRPDDPVRGVQRAFRHVPAARLHGADSPRFRGRGAGGRGQRDRRVHARRAAAHLARLPHRGVGGGPRRLELVPDRAHLHQRSRPVSRRAQLLQIHVALRARLDADQRGRGHDDRAGPAALPGPPAAFHRGPQPRRPQRRKALRSR